MTSAISPATQILTRFATSSCTECWIKSDSIIYVGEPHPRPGDEDVRTIGLAGGAMIDVLDCQENRQALGLGWVK